MKRRAIFIVRTAIPSEQEEAFNRWYNEDHFVKAMDKPGLLSGRRYEIVGTGGANLRTKIEGEDKFRFMAVYEYEDLEILQNWRKSARAKELAAEFTATFPDSERLWTSGVLIYPIEGK